MGVPVRRSRFLHWKPSNVFQRALDEFLMFCASSRIMYCHFTRWKYCWSCRTYPGQLTADLVALGPNSRADNL